MKIILLSDVKSLGKAGDVVEVSDGYARNMLLPRKLGVEATPKNMNDLKLKKAREAKDAAEAFGKAQELADSISKVTVEVAVKTGEGKKVFGSVSAKEIAEAAKTQHGLDIDKKKLVMNGPLKELGLAEIKVKLHPQVVGMLKVNVVEA